MGQSGPAGAARETRRKAAECGHARGDQYAAVSSANGLSVGLLAARLVTQEHGPRLLCQMARRRNLAEHPGCLARKSPGTNTIATSQDRAARFTATAEPSHGQRPTRHDDRRATAGCSDPGKYGQRQGPP